MPHETCWTLIRAAAAGRAAERDEFGLRYVESVQAYLRARWKASSLIREIDDAVQEVFIACFKEGGALGKAKPGLGEGFRVFLFGVVRNIAKEFERNHRLAARKTPGLVVDPPDESPAVSRVYDRTYARAIMREVANRMAERARATGGDAERRVELLRLRFEDGLAVREIAKLWEVDAGELHRESAKAGREFKAVLREVVGLTERCAPDRLDRECDRLLELLR